jgi:hypothetical protein
VARRSGSLRTLEVLEDGTARMSITFDSVEIEMNGMRVESTAEPAELRFMSGRGGGASGAMSVIGEARLDEPFVASVLPMAWPPVFEWPEPTDSGATVSITIRGDESPIEYRRWPSAPEGVTWIGLAGDLPVVRSPTSSARAHVSGLVARTHDLESRARLALGSSTDPLAGVEIEMTIGDGLTLPEPEPGGLLSCVDAVRTFRARLDGPPLPPFVLNRPIEDALLTDDGSEGVGPGLLLDLRRADGESGLDALFAELDPSLPSRDQAALVARMREQVTALERTTEIVTALTGVSRGANGEAPIYLLLDADASARHARAIADALAEGGREARIVVRRPTTGPREGMLRGSLWPIAERLVERAADCPFIARAVAELQTRDVVAAPGWVRAVVAGGIGTCGCNEIMADELAREVLRWSDVSLQSWGWKAVSEEVGAEATVGEVYGGAGVSPGQP